jgi:hypothetical protein
MAIWLRLPLTAPGTAAAAAEEGSSSSSSSQEDSWETWYRFFTMCERSSFLGEGRSSLLALHQQQRGQQSRCRTGLCKPSGW